MHKGVRKKARGELIRQRYALLAALAVAAALGLPAVATGALGIPAADPTVPAHRDTEPVILTGANFPDWSVPANQTAKAPLTDISFSCPTGGNEGCKHNHYENPDLDTAAAQNQVLHGTPVDELLGYRWDVAGNRFVQIPFQVDEVFTRYLDNQASGFAIYSGEDQHTTYAFDREGFRFTANDPSDPCKAVPALDPAADSPAPGGPPTTPDPVPGVDNNDELVFMASDAGPLAPPGAKLPRNIAGASAVAITDPLTGAQSYAYVMKAAADGPAPAYNADNGYVHYERDANSGIFQYSQSSYDNYGNAPKGIYCHADGTRDTSHGATAQRRPGDYATITTPRYRFRYDGRWLLTGLGIANNDDGDYGPNLIDRWKARAFAQDPSSETPCCGYEEEDTNWGGSSQLLGERVGPVRAIRETWGADSGTNVIRRETFYRDEMRQKTWLRVHVIPPADGIYSQWDFRAGVVDRYYNDRNPNGVPIDGKNDEMLGNLDDPCNAKYDAANNPNNTSSIDQTYRSTYKSLGACSLPYHLSIDPSDPTFSDLNAALGWNETAGPNGTLVDRYQIDKVTDLTPGGTPQSLAAVPYYRDDSCFDDGTGSDPGPRIRLRSSDEQLTYIGTDGQSHPRKCWDSNADAAIANGDKRYFQGDIGAHGLHLLFQVDSDNARMTIPLTEIVAENRMVMLTGERDGLAGEQYGRGFEKPLIVATANVPLYAPGPTGPNQAPSAAFGFNPGAPTTGQAVSFDGSASSDPDGSIANYAWDFGDGATATGATPTHSYAKSGTYAVTLTVTDDEGATDTVEHDRTVIAPTIKTPPISGTDRPMIGTPSLDLESAKVLKKCKKKRPRAKRKKCRRKALRPSRT